MYCSPGKPVSANLALIAPLNTKTAKQKKGLKNNDNY